MRFHVAGGTLRDGKNNFSVGNLLGIGDALGPGALVGILVTVAEWSLAFVDLNRFFRTSKNDPVSDTQLDLR
jgi:hypothetical protein